MAPPVSSTVTTSTVDSALSYPGPVFSMPPVSTDSVSTTPFTFPEPLSSVLTTNFPAALPPSFSMPLRASSATPSQQVSTSPEASHSLSSSLTHNLQDLALLDLGSPKKWVVLLPQIKLGREYGSTPIGHTKHLGCFAVFIRNFRKWWIWKVCLSLSVCLNTLAKRHRCPLRCVTMISLFCDMTF